MAAVKSGASIGFLLDISVKIAMKYWKGRQSHLGGLLDLIVARDQGQIVGCVQVERCPKENGKHRAEVQKLFVNPNYRGRSLATRLMAEVEKVSIANGIQLLVLDTQTGSSAEKLYIKLGWQKVGEIPDFALSPNGECHATSYFYKQI